MATKYDITENVSVQLYLPDTDAFVLGISKLNEGKLGDSVPYEWVDFTCDIVSIEIDNSISLDQGVLARPEPMSLIINAANSTLDPTVDTRIRPTIPVRVRANYFGGGTTVIGTQTIGQGFIEDIVTSYDENGNISVRITATNIVGKVMNMVLPEVVLPDFQSFENRLNAIRDYCLAQVNAYGLTVWGGTIGGLSRFMPYDNIDVNSGEIINETLDGENGVLSANSSGIIQGFGRDRVALSSGLFPAALEFGTSQHHANTNHVCISDPVVSLNTQNIINQVKADLTWDAGVVVDVKNQESMDLWGARSATVSLALAASSDLQSWADDIVLVEPQRLVETLTTNIDDVKNGVLTLPTRYTQQLWMELAPLYQVDVYIETDDILIDDTYRIIGLTHRIDPDNWYQELRLWKPL